MDNRTILLLQDSPNIINVTALVDIINPYSPNMSRVVYGFLMKYATSGSLDEKLRDNRIVDIEINVRIKWALDITKGLLDMHANGLVHGDIKPKNVVITATNVAKLIDFSGNQYSKEYHAPEMLTVAANAMPWPKTLDIYSFD
jgi:serine/threonine protein kinase